ncbi:MAG: DNA polymerase III subunit delta [Bacteroidales bacterium]|nr:DNA polymerase III subunit delta [Bacteroidales bacterium]MCL2133078.1 DNA polymerase III subunit delta [Bacteroidales bacterium]
MQFQSVIGQEELKKKLAQTVGEGRVSHAQLFWGMEGSGNLALALAYAQYLNCTNRSALDACGVCPSCNKMQKLIHPDLHFAVPVNVTKNVPSDKKPITDHFLNQWRQALLANPYLTENQWYEQLDIENKQGRISVHEANRIIERLSFKAFESEYKVLILWLPERMGAEAANRLLKLIEEPPDKTVFLLVCEDTTRIIKTILSRTMPLRIPPISETAIRQALIQEQNLSEAQAADIARLSVGSYNKALELLQSKNEQSAYFEWFTYIMRMAYAGRFLDLLNWIETITKAGREKQKQFLLYAEQMLRECYMFNCGADKAVYLMGEEEIFARKFSPFVNERNVEELFKQLNLALGHIGQNGNASMVFTDLFLQIGRLLRK